MNKRSSRYFIVSLALLVLVSLFVTASLNPVDNMRRELLVKVISFAIQNGHYDPGKMDDEFSGKMFDLYLERLDFGKRFFLQEDIDRLSGYRDELDDALATYDFTFFDESVELLSQRQNEAESYYRQFLEKPFDYSKDEEYELDLEKYNWAGSRDELIDRWRRLLKYEVMTRVYDMTKDQEKAAEKSDTVTVKSFEELEQEAREKVLKRYEDWFHRLGQLDENDYLNTYLNAFVNVIDLHTEYFPPKDKENFDIRFSGQLEGIGAQLTQKDAYIEVTRIIPGSPSWKQGELEVGDKILKVQQEGEEPVDVVDMRLDEAVQLIRGKKGTKVTLSVRKLDGTVKEITLVRDVVILEETYARSAVITDPETGKKYGYLKLPSFYVDFSKSNGRNCFDDVRDELRKLDQEDIAGLIFDLRDNGGGSLEDVVDIAGLFINEGPVVQARGRNGMKRILEDDDPRVQFDKPMVVMVNMVSASASEIFAAAMQDYNRAVIMGSMHTYGKGTVQNFTDLDRMVPRKPSDMEPLGSLKLTVQKFYRINGDATQLKGVAPDVIMPDYFNYMDFGEKDLDYPMAFDRIDPLKYEKWNTTYNFDEVVRIAEERISHDTLMQKIDENGARLEQIRESSTYPLNYEAYTQLLAKREKEGKKYERIGKDTLGLQITYLNADREEIVADTSRQARFDSWITNLKKDAYLLQATSVVGDMVTHRVAEGIKND
ncbi:MAG: carboxy terminal-processing peptidase [Bacteroidales bacterium]